jgi:hypothetical protein
VELRSRLVYLAALLGFTALFCVMCALAPHVSMDVRVAYSLAFALVSAEIVLVTRVTPVESRRSLALLVLVSVMLVASQRGAHVSVLGAALVAAGLLLGAGALGASLGARIERPGHLVAVAIMSALADLWSVYDPQGLSARMAEQAVKTPDQLVLFALAWPMLGTDKIEPMIGAGDILFTALYLAAYRAHGLRVGRVMVTLGAGYLSGLVAILVTERPVPLLPLLGVAAVVADARTRSLPAHEKRTVLIMSVVMASVLAVRFLR